MYGTITDATHKYLRNGTVGGNLVYDAPVSRFLVNGIRYFSPAAVKYPWLAASQLGYNATSSGATPRFVTPGQAGYVKPLLGFNPYRMALGLPRGAVTDSWSMSPQIHAASPNGVADAVDMYRQGGLAGANLRRQQLIGNWLSSNNPKRPTNVDRVVSRYKGITPQSLQRFASHAPRAALVAAALKPVYNIARGDYATRNDPNQTWAANIPSAYSNVGSAATGALALDLQQRDNIAYRNSLASLGKDHAVTKRLARDAGWILSRRGLTRGGKLGFGLAALPAIAALIDRYQRQTLR
jgi:hypothetical protein